MLPRSRHSAKRRWVCKLSFFFFEVWAVTAVISFGEEKMRLVEKRRAMPDAGAARRRPLLAGLVVALVSLHSPAQAFVTPASGAQWRPLLARGPGSRPSNRVLQTRMQASLSGGGRGSSAVSRVTDAVSGKDVVLVGTMHGNPASSHLVATVVKEELPRAVLVELCDSRWNVTAAAEWNATEAALRPMSFRRWVYRDEFQAAFEAAKESGLPGVELIDQVRVRECQSAQYKNNWCFCDGVALGVCSDA